MRREKSNDGWALEENKKANTYPTNRHHQNANLASRCTTVRRGKSLPYFTTVFCGVVFGALHLALTLKPSDTLSLDCTARTCIVCA